MNNDQAWLQEHLWKQVLVGMVLGLGVGVGLSPSGFGLLTPLQIAGLDGWIALPGIVFLRLIQMVVVMLVSSSIIVGIAGEENREVLKGVGYRIAPYFVMTTSIAVLIGVGVALVVQPGLYVDATRLQLFVPEAETSTALAAAAPIKDVPELIAELIPANLAEADHNRNMLQIVVAALLMGAALSAIPRESSQHVLQFARGIQDLSMKIVSWAMRLAPVAVFGLLCDITLRVGVEALAGLSMYVACVLVGLLLLQVFYLVLVSLLAQRNPWQFLAQIREAQLLAFSTSSSAAVLPVSLQISEKKLRVRGAIARLIIPLGATVNMDGTALYQVVAALFLTQIFGIELSVGSLVVLVATTVGASIGAPSAPGVGIVILATIIEGMGVPTSGIALILGVDRILDMCRTAVNVTGDLTACVVIEKWLGKKLKSVEA